MICINILVLCNIDLDEKWGDYTRVFSIMKSLSLQKNKIFILIIRPDTKKPRVISFKKDGMNIIQIHPPSLGLSKNKGLSRHLKYLACIPLINKEASKIINENKIDWIYSYMPGTGSSLPASRIKNKFHIPMILDLADMYSMIRPKLVVEKSFRDADKIFVITQYLENLLIKKGIPQKKIFHVPNGVDLELFDPKKYLAESQIIRKNFGAEKFLVFTGSLQDLNIIIKSAKKVIQHIPNLKYIIVGDHRDPKKSYTAWQKEVKKEGLSDNFEFLGRKPRDEIPKYIMCADICLDSFPDEPYFAAAHPIKLLEYGACGKPVVATSVTETANLIEHGKFGYLAKPGNYEEYANYLITLLESDDMAQKMGIEFGKFVRDNFDWNKISSKINDYLLKFNS